MRSCSKVACVAALRGSTLIGDCPIASIEFIAEVAPALLVGVPLTTTGTPL